MAEVEMAGAAWEHYLGAYAGLIGDERTRRTFGGILQGIIAGESLRAAVIARFSPRTRQSQAR